MRKSHGAGGSASQYLVVAVDDDPRVRESLDNLFASALVQARTLASGEDALLLLGQEDAGCLITDIRMPGMDGWELHRRAHLIRPELPVIFVTAHQDQQAQARAMALNAFAFLYKPIDGEELLSTIHAALNSRTDTSR